MWTERESTVGPPTPTALDLGAGGGSLRGLERKMGGSQQSVGGFFVPETLRWLDKGVLGESLQSTPTPPQVPEIKYRVPGAPLEGWVLCWGGGAGRLQPRRVQEARRGPAGEAAQEGSRVGSGGKPLLTQAKKNFELQASQGHHPSPLPAPRRNPLGNSRRVSVPAEAAPEAFLARVGVRGGVWLDLPRALPAAQSTRPRALLST